MRTRLKPTRRLFTKPRPRLACNPSSELSSTQPSIRSISVERSQSQSSVTAVDGAKVDLEIVMSRGIEVKIVVCGMFQLKASFKLCWANARPHKRAWRQAFESLRQIHRPPKVGMLIRHQPARTVRLRLFAMSCACRCATSVPGTWITTRAESGQGHRARPASARQAVSRSDSRSARMPARRLVSDLEYS